MRFASSRIIAIGVLASVGLMLAANHVGAESPEVSDRVQQLLDQAATAATASERRAAAATLTDISAEVVPELIAFLGRSRHSSADEHRAVLRAIKADIPDRKGRFARPKPRGKRRAKPKVPPAAVDWLAALTDLDRETPGLGEVTADVAAIRALAASRDMAAAEAVLDFAFNDVGLVYRDECGRYLRKMAPYSLPALITGAGSRKRRALARYATYQLERLDRETPSKAVNHASIDKDVHVAVMVAYGKSKPREAVAVVLAATNHHVTEVREAARKSWFAYITGPEPPPAPKRRLTLPGGRLTDEEEPLWLTYRELANVELRRTYREVMGERAPRRRSLRWLSKTLFAHFDQVRSEAEEEALSEAAARGAAGDWAAAIAVYDTVLARTPDHPERSNMARAYVEYGKVLAAAGQWRQAAAVFSKAYGLAPDAAYSADALASHHMALGKAMSAAGRDGTLALQRGVAIDPEPSAVQGEPAAEEPEGASGRWMLYAGLGGSAGAAILFILSLALRRR